MALGADSSGSGPAEQLIELSWAPLNKAKKDGKGRVTARNCFQVPVSVTLLDYDGSRRISEQTAEPGASHEVLRTQQAGRRFTFAGSDGHVVVVRAQPADWQRGTWYEEWILQLARENGRVSISNSQTWQAAQGHRRFESERLGVGACYLLEEFEQQARLATDLPDPTFHQIAPNLAFGDHGLGKGFECPRDGRPGCSIVDALPVASRGRATHFLSWAWGYTLSTFLGAIQEWVDQAEIDTKATFLWVCFFCNNQFRILEEQSQEGSDNLEKSFANRLTEVGRVIVLFDAWRSSFYLQRAWCVFETFMADKVGADVQIILPSSEARSLETEIRGGGLGNVIRAFRDVNIEKARATREVDERRVKDLIAQTSSFERVNQVVKDRLVQWCKERFSVILEDEVSSPTPAVGGADFPSGERGLEQGDPGGLAAENARLQAALAERDATIAMLEAEMEQLKISSARDREELAALKASLAALRPELAQTGGSSRPSTSEQRQQRHSEGPEQEGGLGEELESLMDSIVDEAESL